MTHRLFAAWGTATALALAGVAAPATAQEDGTPARPTLGPAVLTDVAPLPCASVGC